MPTTETQDQKIARLRAARLEAEKHRRTISTLTGYYPILSMQDELQFGKYAGQTIEDVLSTKRGEEWLRWALSNLKNFEVDQEVEDELRYLEDPRRPIQNR